MNNDIGFDEIEAYWDDRPCNVRHSDSEIGSKEYFLEVSKRRYLVEPHIKKFVSPEFIKGQTVLELGCGIGTDAAYFVESGANYFGIELSNESLKISRQRFDAFKLIGHFSKTKIEDLDLTQLNWPKPTVVYSFGVLHHTLDPKSALKKVSDQVDKGTIFKVMLYAKNSLKSALINQGLDQFEAQESCPVAFTYSQDESRDLFQNAGLKVQSIEQDHIFSYNLDAYRRYEYKTEPWFAAMPKEYFDALKRELGWHLLITAVKI